MKILASVAALSAVLLTTQLAKADDGTSEKDPQTAFALSLGGTAASLGVMGIGMAAQNSNVFTLGLVSTLVTPSIGEWYAGKPLTWGMGLRAAGATAFLGGAVLAFKCWGDDSGSCHSDEVATGVLVFGGAGAYVGGIIYDIATAGTAAEEFNREHALSLAPTMIRGANNTTTMGFGIGGKF